MDSEDNIYRSLFDHANDAIFIHSESGAILAANITASKRLGYSIHDLLQMNVRDLDKSNQALPSPNLLSKLREEGQFVFETIHTTKFGEQLPVEVSSKLIRYGGKEAIFSTARNISRRIAAAERLRRSRETLEEAQRIARIGSWDWRITEQLHEWSDEVFRIFGFEPQEMEVGPELFFQYIHPDDADYVRKQTQQTLATGSPYECIFRIRTRDGIEKVVQELGEVVINEKGEPQRFYGTIRDITAAHNAAQELERSHRDLELYTSLLQHDLRSDLQIVLTQAESFSMLADEGSEAKKVSEVIQSASVRMKKVLDVFTLPSDIHYNDILDMLRNSIKQARATNPELEVELQTENGEPRIGVGAGRLLPLVWANLLRNAADYAGSKARVCISVKQGRDLVQIDFCDNGPGIPRDVLPNLFEKGASTSGRGFGLYLSRKVLQAYGGSIGLMRSNEEEGTCFRITLKRAEMLRPTRPDR